MEMIDAANQPRTTRFRMIRDGRAATDRLVLFAALYAIQGVVVAFFFNFNKPYMIAAGVREDVVGTLESIVLLPFVFKFVFGPISDRFALFGLGHRKPYIIGGLLVQTCSLIMLAFVDPARHLTLFGAVAFATVFGLACYDTCCDGLAVDLTPPEDRSKTQGAMLTARFAATMVCTLLFGLWLEHGGGADSNTRVPHVLLACAALGIIPLMLAFRFVEPKRPPEFETFQWSALRSLVRPWTLALLAFGTLYAIAGMGAEINLSAYYRSIGLRYGDLGTLGAVRYAGRAIGALLLPFVFRRVGQRGCLLIGIVGLAAATAGQVLVRGGLVATPLAFAFGAANGWNDALFGVLAMEAADPSLAASSFALLMAVTNLSVAGDWAFAKAVAAFDHNYRLVYLLASVVVLITLPLAIPLGKSARRDEPEPSDVA